MNSNIKFKDVGWEQVFIDVNGNLCQKVSSASYNIIAQEDGQLWADHFQSVHPDMPVRRVINARRLRRMP